MAPHQKLMHQLYNFKIKAIACGEIEWCGPLFEDCNLMAYLSVQKFVHLFIIHSDGRAHR